MAWGSSSPAASLCGLTRPNETEISCALYLYSVGMSRALYPSLWLARPSFTPGRVFH